MKNFETIIEKLTLNRAKLIMNRFDKELKEILENDLSAFKQGNNRDNKKARKLLVA